ncbi:glycosyltransferase family 2 protein [Algoriphagus sp. A40]|uniref:glycosyltransferase family 2 protein n=1 Tax=Algoriphagus sp. A40 TaxID=1945863 RepID=UPI00098733B2|nr:glycosyltransferase family 2 protein [Algoriphagus sp. A40]OOG68168.1 hypothetical protein B0E43_22465 [Algoriphagus sp. A40]
MNFPLVSICIPTHNGAEFLSEALTSCRNQDYLNLELVISDDASNDFTIPIINELTVDFHFPVKLVHHQPAGIGANWNNCVKHSSGKYIKFLFQDDLLEPTCVSELVSLIESQPNVALAACKRKILFDKINLENESWVSKYADLQGSLERNIVGEYKLTKKDFNYAFFYIGTRNKIGEPSTVLLNKEYLNSVGEFRTDLKQDLDFEYWWRLMDKYTILITSKTLASFRLHPNQSTNKNKRNSIHDYLIIMSLILSKYIWKMPFKDSKKVLIKEIYWAKKTFISQVFGMKKKKYFSNGGKS